MGNGVVFHRDYQDADTIYKSDNMFYYINQVCRETELSLAESFAMGGTYVFADSKDMEPERFYQGLLAFMHRAKKGLSFLWIVNPAQEAWNWRYYSIDCSLKQPDYWKPGSYAEMKFGAYRLIFEGRVRISCREDDMLFTLDTAEHQEDTDAPGILRLNQIIAEINTDNFSLSFSEGSEGTFLFSAELKGDGNTDVFERMNACIKYCAPLGDKVKDRWKQGNLGTISCPVLFSTRNLKLQAHIQPNALDNHEVTYFLLYDTEEENNVYTSSFVDIGGQQKKAAAGADARLVFEKVPRYLYYDTENKVYCGAQSYYLGFAGSFYLQNAEKHLLCGLSGTEFVDVTRAASLEICFHSKQNSFFGAQGQQELCTAAWLSFPQESWYYSQPEIAPMYSLNEDGLLRFLEIPTTKWSTGTPPVPIALYNNCRVSFMDSHDIEDIEKRIYKERYRLITGKVLRENTVRRSNSSQAQVTVTPQGLMAGVIPETGSYDWFAIAQTDTSGELPSLRFGSVSEILRMDLQNSKLFLDKEDKEAFLREAEPVGDFKVTIDGWCFLLSTHDWKTDSAQQNTAFIMKYVKGACMKDLMKESPVFQASLNAAYDDKKQVLPQYRSFIDCVEDPDFQGIIYLNCMVSVQELPQEVEFLLKGVRQEDFYAHHVIFENNKVNQDGQGQLHMEEASVQALVDYKGGESVVYDETMPDYLFTTTRLTVSFVNSGLQNFSSVSEVFMNRFYGAKCTKENTTSGNCMIIDGISQRKDTIVEYVFSLREPCNYILSNSAMKAVRITGAQLSVGSDAGCIGRITLAGGITLHEIPECDVLSYDWLAFGSLQMVVPEEGALYLDYGNLVLNEGSSIPRPQSFGARFACRLEQVIYEDDRMPSDQGYDSITSPVRQGKLQTPWTGLVWKLSLGSLGELANSGELAIRLLICWSSEEQAPVYYVGVALPGIMEGFDVQGIVKLGFQSLELMVSEKAETVWYTLRLHNYTLRLLWLAIPPGSNDLFLFADGKKLGWYAAYLGEEA